MHVGIMTPGYDNIDLLNRLNELVDPFFNAFIRDNGGSISAEHGIGLEKAKYLNYSKTNEMIDVMRQIKNVFDPNGIMNPYKIFV